MILEADLCNFLSIAGQWLYTWQTLISGILALAAAAGTVYFLRKQITQTEKLANGQLERNLAAARAVLPLALSAMNDYVRKVVNFLKRVSHEAGNNSGLFKLSPENEFIDPPTDVIKVFQDLIRFTNDRNIVGAISGISSDIQYIDVWLSEFYEGKCSSWISKENPITIPLVACGVIAASINQVWDFARREMEAIDTSASWADVRNSLKLLEIFPNSFPDVFGQIDNFERAGKTPQRYLVP